MRAAAYRVAVNVDDVRVTARNVEDPRKSSAKSAEDGGKTVAPKVSYFGSEALEVGAEEWFIGQYHFVHELRHVASYSRELVLRGDNGKERAGAITCVLSPCPLLLYLQNGSSFLIRDWYTASFHLK
jgi:hypothetical protein